MGSIISSRREADQVIVETALNHEELVQLKGEIDDIHIFSEKIADVQTNIAKRGKNEATKYFLIPREMRKDLNIMEPVSCQRINTHDKAIFIYVVHKTVFSNVKRISQHLAERRIRYGQQRESYADYKKETSTLTIKA